MRYNPWIGGVAIALMIGLGGCSQTREALGLAKDPPDEFQVVSRAPLSVPPNFNLRPPEPGAPRPQEGTARTQAANALFGEPQPSEMRTGGFGFGSLEPGGALGEDYVAEYTSGFAPALASAAGPSAGERAFLQNAGATNVDPSIRAIVDRETAAMIDQDGSFVERLVFWGEPRPFGTVVDPVKEQQRLQESAELERSATATGAPTITHKRRALLEDLL